MNAFSAFSVLSAEPCDLTAQWQSISFNFVMASHKLIFLCSSLSVSLRISSKSLPMASTQNTTFGRRRARSALSGGFPMSSVPAGIDGRLKGCRSLRNPRTIARWLSCRHRHLCLCTPPQKRQAARSELCWTVCKSDYYYFFPSLMGGVFKVWPQPFLLQTKVEGREQMSFHTKEQQKKGHGNTKRMGLWHQWWQQHFCGIVFIIFFKSIGWLCTFLPSIFSLNLTGTTKALELYNNRLAFQSIY